jgi:hypothetical protein
MVSKMGKGDGLARTRWGGNQRERYFAGHGQHLIDTPTGQDCGSWAWRHNPGLLNGSLWLGDELCCNCWIYHEHVPWK